MRNRNEIFWRQNWLQLRRYITNKHLASTKLTKTPERHSFAKKHCCLKMLVSKTTPTKLQLLQSTKSPARNAALTCFSLQIKLHLGCWKNNASVPFPLLKNTVYVWYFFLNLNFLLVKAVTLQQHPLTCFYMLNAMNIAGIYRHYSTIITDTNALLVRLIHSLLASCNVVTLYRVEVF